MKKQLHKIIFIIKFLILFFAFYSSVSYSQVKNNAVINIPFNTTMNFSGSVTLTGFGSFNNAGTIDLKGDWINNSSNFGFVNSNIGLVIFSGSNQDINGSHSTIFNDISLTGSGIKSISINTEANGILSLNNLELSLNSYSFKINNTNSLSILRTSGFISSLPNGSLYRNTNTVSDYLFPFGKNTGKYNPIIIHPATGNSTQYSSTYINNDPTNDGYNRNSKDAVLDQISSCEYWLINRTSGTDAASVTLGWDQFNCTVSSLPELRVTKWDGTKWISLGNGGTTGTTNAGTIITASAVSTFSPFAYAKLLPPSYAVLKKKLDGGFHLTLNSMLYFKFDEEYNDSNQQLTYNIYNDLHQLISGLPNLSVQYGDNRYSINCSSISGLITGNTYLLEVINEKNEKWYLRFMV